MKRLFVLRHAKSSWSDDNLADDQRPLNKRGKRDAPVIAQRLRQAQLQPALVVSSPATRALKTARIFASELNIASEDIIQDDSLYLASVGDILNVLKHVPDSHESAMVVGHNPGLTNLVNALTPVQLDNLPTSGVFVIDLPVAHWREVSRECVGEVGYYDYPKRLPE